MYNFSVLGDDRVFLFAIHEYCSAKLLVMLSFTNVFILLHTMHDLI